MCGGFTCTKNALKALNLLYIVVSFILIAVATYCKTAAQISDISIIGGIIACGVFLLLLSLLGLIGTAKHHQVMLFFYMVILFLLFVVQFSIACACLAFSAEQKSELAAKGWNTASVDNRNEAQEFFDCCGFKTNDPQNNVLCPNVRCCQVNDCSECSWCENKIQTAIGNALDASGWIGMFFSFTEFIGVWLTIRYRNQKNPRDNLNAFL